MDGPSVLFLFGPTSVGKTDALLSLGARAIEVVSADSMQVYRGMDIGTAKPDAALRAQIPHHLIDLRDPDEQYDVGAFVADANLAIREISARGRLPVVSGGTGYYFRHLLYGLPESPPSDPAVRALVRLRYEQLPDERLHEQLARVDPVSAARIEPGDRYRITRALEVHEQTGRPLSSFAMCGAERTDVRVTPCALVRDADELLRRIERRVDAMFARGLRAEVERLAAAGYGPAAPGMRAIGYREFFAPDGTLRPAADDPDIAGQIVAATRRYAKRQRTFFRSLPRLVEYHAGDRAALGALVERLLGALDSV